MKPHSRFIAFILFGGLTAMGTALFAEPAANPQPVEKAAPELGEVPPAGPALARSDLRSIKKIIACSAYELAMSREASTRAVRDEMRAYAEAVARTQELMNGELTTITKHRGAQIVLDHKQADDPAGLAKKTGADYDKAYLKEIITAHRAMIALLGKASKSDDTDVAAFAVQYEARLRDHLVRARELEKVID